MDELDDLEQIEQQGSHNADFVLSNVYTVRKGGFGIEPNIKTYLTTINVVELQEDVEFYETLSADKDWPISQIIQREVDHNRVNSIAKKYLLGQGRIVKYFPPIIIALIPRASDGTFSQQFDFIVDQSQTAKELVFDKSKYRSNARLKSVLLEKTNESLVSGLYLYSASSVFEHHILSWDKQKFYAVVIDGQHRLDSLIQGKAADPSFANAVQDVVFLDVSTLASQQSTLSPIEILRTIFIDINTNAKSVSLVRRVLMDDKDMASLCVQSLVESIDKNGYSKDEDTFIPSILIDWYGDSLKHELPYLTGILTMYQILSDELVTDRLVTIDDHRNQNKIKRFVELLNDVFFVDYQISNKVVYSDITKLEASFSSYISEKETTREAFSEEIYQDELDSILFNYDYRTLEIAQKTFEEFYCVPFINILTLFGPYNKAKAILTSAGAFDALSTLHRALLLPKKRLVKIETFRTKYLETRQSLFSQLNPKYFLFFTVVGQKGLFKFFFETLFANFDHGITPEVVLEIQGQVLSDLNLITDFVDRFEAPIFGDDAFDISAAIPENLAEFGTIASDFWEGVLFEDHKIVYNSQGVRAFSDVLRFVIDSIKSPDLADGLSISEYSFRYAQARIKRLLKKRFGGRTDAEFSVIADNILHWKKVALHDYIWTKIIPIGDTSA